MSSKINDILILSKSAGLSGEIYDLLADFDKEGELEDKCKFEIYYISLIEVLLNMVDIILSESKTDIRKQVFDKIIDEIKQKLNYNEL